jgi:Leucine-rich repeat (LRR) protein
MPDTFRYFPDENRLSIFQPSKPFDTVDPNSVAELSLGYGGAKTIALPQMRRLRILTTHAARLAELDFSNFPDLRRLYIRGQGAQLSPSVIEPSKLEYIALDDNKAPSNIGSLRKLRGLWVKGKSVMQMPPSIKTCAINTLWLARGMEQPAAPVPNWIWSLPLTALRLSTSYYSAIPKQISKLSRLEKLDLSGALSSLGVFPSLAGLASLKELNLSAQVVQKQKTPGYALFPQILAAIPALGNLQKLDLSSWKPRKTADVLAWDGKRRTITDIFGHFPQLRELDLADMGLESLPASIATLKHLRRLNVYKNRLLEPDVVALAKALPNCEIFSVFGTMNRTSTEPREADTTYI